MSGDYFNEDELKLEHSLNSFPFVAGQRTDKLFGSSHVLCPLPIKTLLPKAGRCDQLVAKTAQYIDIGGVGGLIFQTTIDVDDGLYRFRLFSMVLHYIWRLLWNL
ncbi:hypothetical protein [Vibrio furnissii]|uniref:hypothetical protein n=1 Tax=Vibrio furnissii TaxID=29494 RepID=UPI001EEA7562|nr:hypothetical protein [Vibrio furnissii]